MFSVNCLKTLKYSILSISFAFLLAITSQTNASTTNNGFKLTDAADILQLAKKKKKSKKKNKKKKKKNKKKKTSKDKISYFVGFGVDNFKINEVFGGNIDSTPKSSGATIGLFAPINIFRLKKLYISPYLSSYSGASYQKNSNDIWIDSKKIIIGANLEKRIMISKKLHIAPFSGVKYISMKTTAADGFDDSWNMTAISSPLGANFNFQINKTFGVFLSVSMDAIYLYKHIKIGDYNAGESKIASGINYMIGFSYK